MIGHTNESIESIDRAHPANGSAAPAQDTPHTTSTAAASATPWLRRGLRATIGLLAVVALLLGAALYTEHSFAERVYPNVSIQGIAVGEMTRTEAAAALQARYAGFLTNPVTLRYDAQTWTPTAAELGMQVDFAGALDTALSVGHHDRPIDSLLAGAALWQHGYDVPLRITIDQATMQTYLLTQLAPMTVNAQNARFVIDEYSYQPDFEGATGGQQALIDHTIADITAAVQDVQPATVNIRTRPIDPMLDNASVAAAGDAIATLLRGPLVMEGQGETLQWSVADLMTMVKVERIVAEDGNKDRLHVSLDREVIAEHIEPLAERTETGGTWPRVSWNGGNPTIIQPGTPGTKIDVAAAVDMIEAVLWDPRRNPETVVALPIAEVAVPSTDADLAALGLHDVISVGRSSFYDSEAYRVTNIVAGMRLLDGVLIAPGEEFSFNETIGYIGPETGFVEGYAILESGVDLAWGGGICQDSTTMMRAAYWAGLPFTERWNHSNYIAWYDRFGYGQYGDGPGIDATIFLGGPDLRFVNDTGAWILVEAHADTVNEVATITFYGTKGDRVVEFGGAHVSYPGGGYMSVSFTRRVIEGGEVIRNDTLWSVYEPW